MSHNTYLRIQSYQDQLVQLDPETWQQFKLVDGLFETWDALPTTHQGINFSFNDNSLDWVNDPNLQILFDTQENTGQVIGRFSLGFLLEQLAEDEKDTVLNYLKTKLSNKNIKIVNSQYGPWITWQAITPDSFTNSLKFSLDLVKSITKKIEKTRKFLKQQLSD